MKRTAIIGGGGHAKSLLEFLLEGVAGYVASEASEALGLTYLGNDDKFKASCLPSDWQVHVAIVGGSGRSMSLRRRFIDGYKGYSFATLVAPTAIITPSSEIGEGSAVFHRAVVNGATIGRHCIINTGAIVEHDCRLGENVFVGPGAVICGGVTVGDDCFIGAGATVRNCSTICSGVSIGMGAVVVGDITSPGVYVGSPAKPLKQ